MTRLWDDFYLPVVIGGEAKRQSVCAKVPAEVGVAGDFSLVDLELVGDDVDQRRPYGLGGPFLRGRARAHQAEAQRGGRPGGAVERRDGEGFAEVDVKVADGLDALQLLVEESDGEGLFAPHHEFDDV
jgi:hypothetical protein